SVCIAKNAWAVDFSGKVSHWDGSNWSAPVQVAANNGSLHAIAGASAAEVWAFGAEYPNGTSQPSQAMAYRLSGSSTWAAYDVTQFHSIGRRAWPIGPLDYWAIAEAQGQATIAHGMRLLGTTASFDSASFGSTVAFIAGWASGPDDVWAVGVESGTGAAF